MDTSSSSGVPKIRLTDGWKVRMTARQGNCRKDERRVKSSVVGFVSSLNDGLFSPRKGMNKMANYFRMSALAVVLSLGCQAAMAASDDFVEDASAKGVAEIEAGKLAQEKGTSADVKTFAAQMIKDHTAANEKLKTIAQSKKLEISDDAMLLDKAKAMILELRGAKSFDQAYANNQVKAHEQTIELFEEEAKNGKDAELKAFATATLPALKTHLEHAKALAKAHGGSAAKE
jgi:putative membrane protein